MWDLFAHAAWKVTLVSLILGAGLPAIFAIGVRETVLATGDGQQAPRSPVLHRSVGVLCFVVVIAAVVVGLTIILASGLGKAVSFEHIYPTIVDKS